MLMGTQRGEDHHWSLPCASGNAEVFTAMGICKGLEWKSSWNVFVET